MIGLLISVGQQLLSNKYGIFVVLLALAAFGGWKAHDWYTGDQTRSHLERAIDQFNKQAEEDAELLAAGIKTEEVVRTEFIEVKDEASKTELCADGGNGFLGVFNTAVGAANTE